MRILIITTLTLLYLSNPANAAIFAEIKGNNTVGRVIIADSEEWCTKYLGSKWVETFTDNPNKNYASKGDDYLEIHNDFCKPQPYPSWVMDEKRMWKAPIDMPKDGKNYRWNENLVNWEEIINP